MKNYLEDWRTEWFDNREALGVVAEAAEASQKIIFFGRIQIGQKIGEGIRLKN